LEANLYIHALNFVIGSPNGQQHRQGPDELQAWKGDQSFFLYHELPAMVEHLHEWTRRMKLQPSSWSWAMVVALVLPLAAAETELDQTRASLEKLGRVFPELFWHASDAWMRETTAAGGGQISTKEEFIKAHKVDIEKIARLGKEATGYFMGRIKMHDPNEPDDFWLFDFALRAGRWTAHGGVKVIGKRQLNLYEADLFTGSMKPYIEKGLQAYAEGKKFADVFPRKENEKGAKP
jgi:hypothetical protein